MGFEETEKLYVSAIEAPTSPQAILFELDDQTLKLVSPLEGLTDEKAYVDLAGTSTERLFGPTHPMGAVSSRNGHRKHWRTALKHADHGPPAHGLVICMAFRHLSDVYKHTGQPQFCF